MWNTSKKMHNITNVFKKGKLVMVIDDGSFILVI